MTDLPTAITGRQDDEWEDGRRYLLPESMAWIDAIPATAEVSRALLMASQEIRRGDDALLHHASRNLTGGQAAQPPPNVPIAESLGRSESDWIRYSAFARRSRSSPYIKQTLYGAL